MTYRVQVEGDSVKEFESVESALEFAARQVYLPADRLRDAKDLLSAGSKFCYAYGFKQVEIETKEDL